MKHSVMLVIIAVAVAFFCIPAVADDANIIGSWTSGASHDTESGSDRLLLFIAHGEDNSDISVTSVTYGGESMTKVDDLLTTTSTRAYCAAFYLKESDIANADGNAFVVTWDTTPDEVTYSSVFLEGVDQTNPIGDNDNNWGTSSTLTTSALSTSSGDIVIVSATCGNTGSYTMNNSFTRETQVVGSSLTAASGAKDADGSNETPSVSHAYVNRQVMLGFVVQAGSGGAPTYTLTVTSGSGDGSYEEDDVVNISADAPGTGQVFDAWTGDTTNVADTGAANTTITMPAAAASVTATYVDVDYTLTVTDGTGDGTYNYNDVANISDDAPAQGYEFDVWTGDTTGVANVNNASTTLTMPAANAAVTATYATIDYTLTVNSGSGDGDYDANTVVNISADAPTTGKYFDVWTGDTTNVANTSEANTTITMPAANAAVTATYGDYLYALTVTDGTGDGNYAYNTAVNIYAADPNAGQVFDAWTGDTTNVANVNDANTTITMPASAAAVTATYAADANDSNAVAGLTGEYYDTTSLTTLKTTRVDSTVDFTTWGSVPTGTDVTADNMYSERWTGYVEIETDGNWTFYTYSNDGVRLWVDDNQIIDNWDDHGAQEDSYTLNLTAGWYPITLEHYQSGGSVVIQLSFSGPGQSKAIIPSTNLSTESGGGPTTYTLTVNSGSGDGSYEEDDVVNISADAPPANQVFDVWTGDTTNVADTSEANTTITMPAAAAAVTATYVTDPNSPTTYTLTVSSGSGDGSYEEDDVVNISADAPATGKYFDAWTGDTTNVADTGEANTTITMPAANAAVTATYVDVNYTLTVNSGTGDGTYNYNDVVNIYADAPDAGDVFDAWTGDTSGIADTSDPNTTITMPAANAAVTATYAADANDSNAVAGLTGEYYDTTSLATLKTTRVDSTVDFTTWGSAPSGTDVTADNMYSERWTGYVEIETNGNWTFYTYSNDGVRLWVDDNQIINNWDDHGAQEDSYTLNLTAGWYPIKLEHYQNGGSVVIQLSFSGPGQSKAIIPSTNLSTESGGGPTSYTLTVNSGSGDGDYEEDDVVNISADAAPAGQIFDAWTGDTTNVADVDDANTTITMPAANAAVTATYQDDPSTYQLTVNSGSGDGFYSSSSSVDITANTASTGQVFDEWTGDTTNVVDTDDPTTSITMPAADTEITATYVSDPNYTAPNRGYLARACGFDFDHDGVLGEDPDDMPWKNVTASTSMDIDGDGTNEDIIYVDSYDGDDSNGDGSPNNPYQTIQKAFDMADGPGDGAEDIICIYGTFHEAVTLTQSGVSGYYTRDDFQFPTNPFMLIGWDKDGDGEFPPYDTDDEAVLDGNYDFDVAFDGDRQSGISAKSYLEFAHLSVREFGKTSGGIRGAFHFRGSGPENSYQTHINVHDVEMYGINKNQLKYNDAISFRMWRTAGGSRPGLQYLAVINCEWDECGGYFMRGEGLQDPDKYNGEYLDEHLRFQNLTLNYYGLYGGWEGPSNPSQPWHPSVTGWKMWCNINYVEIMDSIINGNIAEWLDGSAAPLTGVMPVAAVQHWKIVNNEFIDLAIPIQLQPGADGQAGYNPMDDILIDRNLIYHTGYYDAADWKIWRNNAWQHLLASAIVIGDGKTSGSMVWSVENATITNNMVAYPLESYGMITVKKVSYGSMLPPQGTITIAGNSFYTEGIYNGHVNDGDYAGISITLADDNDSVYVIKNNVFAGLDSTDYNIRTDNSLSNFTCNGNVYDPDADYYWNGSKTFAEWKSTTGEDANSIEADANFVDDANGDLHLLSSSESPVGAGVDISNITDHDFDGDTRDANTLTAGADVP